MLKSGPSEYENYYWQCEDCDSTYYYWGGDLLYCDHCGGKDLTKVMVDEYKLPKRYQEGQEW